MLLQEGRGWLELCEMAEQPDYDLETFVNKAECALAQQAKHFSALQGGCGQRMGPLRVMAALPEGMGPLRDPLTLGAPPFPSRCPQGLAPSHASRRAGQQTNKHQETAPLTTANKDLFGVTPSLFPSPSLLNELWAPGGSSQGLSWESFGKCQVWGHLGPGQLGRGQSAWDTTFLFLSCSHEGNKDGKRELLVILCAALLSKRRKLSGVEFSLGQHSARVDWLLVESSLGLSWLLGEGRNL